MSYLILVSHGRFSEGLKDALSMFIGDDIETVKAIGLQSDDDVKVFGDRFRALLTELNADSKLIVLGDIIGGSPLTEVINILSQEDKLEKATILGGMNFPMALNAAILKDSLNEDELVPVVLKEATAAVKQFTLTEESDEDEDDI
ncbi:PTS sugar transporter subunit IIA [Leuconostoc miyukkimchii]|uniref:PTS sugar transporter subunit IIA n=1 Tax=Leuconostoc miyukkimchii TaxID=910540 RepID=UPI001C7D906C|nr:PTS fructose transporter subunit IIA [Leuconostoc miyukkimchii]